MQFFDTFLRPFYQQYTTQLTAKHSLTLTIVYYCTLLLICWMNSQRCTVNHRIKCIKGWPLLSAVIGTGKHAEPAQCVHQCTVTRYPIRSSSSSSSRTGKSTSRIILLRAQNTISAARRYEIHSTLSHRVTDCRVSIVWSAIALYYDMTLPHRRLT